jgi:hypothetical protein
MKSSLKLGPFEFEPCRVRVRGRPPAEDWTGPLSFALWCQRASPWWIGDLLNAGDDGFGEAFYQMCESFGISTEMIERYKGVARRVSAENRRPGLSWSSHAMVARLPADQQQSALDEAERQGWSSEELRRYLQARNPKPKRKGTAEKTPDPDSSTTDPREIP